MSRDEESDLELDELRALMVGGRVDERKERIEQLLRRVDSILDRRMRAAAVAGALERRSDPEVVATLADAIEAAMLGDRRARTLIEELALSPSLLSDMPRERIENLQSLASGVGLSECASTIARSIEAIGASTAITPSGNRALPLPLGVRRQAARTTDRFTIDRLLRDRDHRVISLLLQNPRVRERDVVTIAAQRPTTPEIMRCIAGHHRWGSAPSVRVALAANPATPSEISVRLLPTLLIQELETLITVGDLSPVIRGEALRLRERHRR